MKYKRMETGRFLERPNRFIAYVELSGKRETVHVKNTGRCAELLQPNATVYVQKADNPERKTQWDLIGVKKGRRMVNMDSQIPNKVVEEFLRAGNLFPDAALIRPETTYRNSRFDFYIEDGERKIFMEVKGVTLEQDGIVKFPDAPTERGVKILAYDCKVTEDSIQIADEVPVFLGNPNLGQIAKPLVAWYQKNKRDLPWRHDITAYKVWVSEIMLQQTRVEAVKPYFARFLDAFPTIADLAAAEEDTLLKMWEGLGYYNRVRNMQKAAQQIVAEFDGEFPRTYEEIKRLTGIGNYTAGAIASFAFGVPKPAVDGNVLRVISRLTASYEDIMRPSVREQIEQELEVLIPQKSASDFNQGLIELGATVCVPNGTPKCEECPLATMCRAKEQGVAEELPIKSKGKERRIEEKTVFLFQDGEHIAICKRPAKGLLAGLYELPNVSRYMTEEEAILYSKEIGLRPLHIRALPEAKHIFSHVEWHMRGYGIRVDELERANTTQMLFIHPEEIEKEYPIPAAIEFYARQVSIKLGQEKYEG